MKIAISRLFRGQYYVFLVSMDSELLRASFFDRFTHELAFLRKWEMNYEGQKNRLCFLMIVQNSYMETHVEIL